MKNTIALINELKEQGLIRDYAIGGAIGVLKWVEPFFTRDLDIFIIPIAETKEGLINLSAIYEYLKKKGCQWKGQWLVVAGTPVDFIPVDALEKEAVENAQVTGFDEIRTKVITPEYLVVLLLKTGRDKDVRKIEMLLEQAKIDRKRLDVILARYGLTEKFTKFMEKHDGGR